jgi:redox-sensitive bicupin YhaK (pirin superfamily)
MLNTVEKPSVRDIVHRTRGTTHGMITRLMSPGDLGELLKPFVFLDLFDDGGRPFKEFGLHPHSGIATLTYILEGRVTYEDTNGASGVLGAGGVEWMQAGGGVWHGGGGADAPRTRGFQLWVSLPPEKELGAPVSLYQNGGEIPAVGPARVLLGSHSGAVSGIETPSPMTYLAVSLKAGEQWRFEPEPGHDVLWAAVATGALAGDAPMEAGELAVFEAGQGPVVFTAASPTEFVLGSARRHPHDLVLGYYSVHTSGEALRIGEARIQEIGADLRLRGLL